MTGMAEARDLMCELGQMASRAAPLAILRLRAVSGAGWYSLKRGTNLRDGLLRILKMRIVADSR